MIFMHGPKIIARASLVEHCEIFKDTCFEEHLRMTAYKTDQSSVLQMHPCKEKVFVVRKNHERSSVCKNDVSISYKWYIDFMFRENV